MTVVGETSILKSHVSPEKPSETHQDTSSSDESSDAQIQEEQNRKESAGLIDELFYSLPQSVDRCTFGSASTNLKLKDSHIRKVLKYANRRLEKMNWSLLMERSPMHKECSEFKLPLGLKHKEVKVGDLLGEGSFSTVYARKKQPEHVIKILRKKMMHNPAMLAACAADLVKEGWILATLAGSENVIQVHGWQENGLHTLNNGFHDGFFLILERLQYTLGDKIKEWQKRKSKISNPFSLRRRGGMSNGEAKLQILRERLLVIPQVASGIGSMHKMGLIHRDLKPDNIGLGLDGNWKIFDLDVARICPTRNRDHYCTKGFRLTKRVGSPRYMSPECAKGIRYNCLTDVYSFGLIVHELITLLKPYDEVPSELHDQQIFYEHHRPEIAKQWPISMKYFLESSWHKDWSHRPNLASESFHNSLKHRILPDFLEYKQGRYSTARRSSFFIRKSLPLGRLQTGGGKHRTSENHKGVTEDDLETSFLTLYTGSFRTDFRDVSPTIDRTQVLSV
eukprot:CAMPEP_0113612486 /NCGR_PEP_ID=MMETSP0017_2-20120614/6126_1 /TAXON_ID=2856 /ORGANISM="Cylindrotheca closterium" /LENGTH=506 /DNA_ID=CAMNT_0000521525 /DNA_START=57 /DNA_END=1577 /DNA_ORIENTATION=- /assembly_acc=CAM_ASM_000147